MHHRWPDILLSSLCSVFQKFDIGLCLEAICILRLPSAPFAVEAAGSAFGLIGVPLLQTDVLWLQGDGAIFEQEGRDADVAYLLGVGEGGVMVAQTEEFLELPHVRGDVNNLETLVTFTCRSTYSQ